MAAPVAAAGVILVRSPWARRVAIAAAGLLAAVVLVVMAAFGVLGGSGTARPGGFLPGASVGLDAEQLAQATRALSVADDEHADGLPLLAMVVGALGESGFRPVPNARGSGYCGVFQADPANIPCEDTEEQARSFIRGGKGFQQGGAIKLAHDHPHWSPGLIATLVEASGQPPGFYDVHRPQAERIIAAWQQGASAFPPGLVEGALVAEADRMINLHQPYLWGGGHGPGFNINGPWDCSGAMSQLMHHLGLLQAPAPIDSTGFMSQGRAGRGQDFTIYANPDHVFLIVEQGVHKGQAWGTANRTIGGRAPISSGPNWHVHTTAGFVARHYPGH